MEIHKSISSQREEQKTPIAVQNSLKFLQVDDVLYVPQDRPRLVGEFAFPQPVKR